MLSVGTLVKGRYEITSLIGRGGMSYVFKAVDKVNGNILAIKQAIRNGVKDNQAMETSLVTEGRLLKSLSNPHLPRIYDVIEDRDDIMIVMDFVEGQSLDKVLAQYGAIAPEKVIEWGIQICDVFYYLHTQNPPVIYRDMKPANVILQPNGNIMMIDFGTARTWKLDGFRTSDTMLIGTEGFAAPEQFGGLGQSDARTDIFCLGATLFNLVTNHSPYRKPFGITPLGDWDPKLKDSPLDKIIQKCTERDPYARFQTARELQEALIAAKNPGGRTRFFSLLSGSSKKNKGWQSPEMKASDGKSKFLLNRHAQNNQASQQNIQQIDISRQARQAAQAQVQNRNAQNQQQMMNQQQMVNQPAQNMQMQNRQMQNMQMQNRQVQNQPPQNIQVQGQPAQNMQMQNQQVPNRQMQGQPVQNRQIPNGQLQSIQTQNGQLQRRPIQNRQMSGAQAGSGMQPWQQNLSGQPYVQQQQQYQNQQYQQYQNQQYQNQQMAQYPNQLQDVQTEYTAPEPSASLKMRMIIAFIIGGMFLIIGVLMLVAGLPVVAVIAFVLGIAGIAAGVIFAVNYINN